MYSLFGIGRPEDTFLLDLATDSLKLDPIKEIEIENIGSC